MAVTASTKISPAVTVKWALSLLIPLAIWLIPANAVFTVQIRWFAVWTCWMLLVVAFDLLVPFIPAFLMPVMYYITGVAPSNVCFSGWTATIVFVIVGAFVLAEALTDCGLLIRIATWVIIRTGGTVNGSSGAASSSASFSAPSLFPMPTWSWPPLPTASSRRWASK